MGCSPARVVRAYYDIISYPKAQPDRYYWGFEGPTADAAAKALARSVLLSVMRLEALGQQIRKDVARELKANNGEENAKVRAEVIAGVARMRAFAKVEWQDIADELINYADADAHPPTSRAGCYYGYQALYGQFAQRAAMHPATAELEILYTQLQQRVIRYFEGI